MTVLVVSPHLDDAVLSAGQFLAATPGAVVLTVLAGVPTDTSRNPVEDWPNDVQERRAEDLAATASLGAQAVHGALLDGCWGYSPTASEVSALIHAVADEIGADMVLGPLGVKHPDHLLVNEGFLWQPFDCEVWLYEDLPYSVLHPGMVADARAWAKARGFVRGDLPQGALDAKRAAVDCYPSQTRVIGDDLAACWVPEQFWRLA